MPENYEVLYTHPGGATATFVRQDGELDALAKGLDAEQFWVFKNVKALLVRNDDGDLDEANRLMGGIGFAPMVRVLTTPQRIPEIAAMTQPVEMLAEDHHGIHLPNPSFWPLALGISVAVALSGLLISQITLAVTAIGLVMVLLSIVSWGLEPAS